MLFLLTLILLHTSQSIITLQQITSDDIQSINWTSEIETNTINSPTSADSLTPLQAASKYNAIKIIAALLSHGVDINQAHPSSGETSVMYAARVGSNAALNLLLVHGADATLLDNDKRTALHLAALDIYPGGESSHIVKMLSTIPQIKINPNAMDTRGNTPLHLACYFGGDPEFVEELLLHLSLSEIDTPDVNGNTALMFCAGKGKLAETLLLLKAGADISLQNKNGETALNRAEKNSSNEIVVALSNDGEL
jgi:uncharacterized protein